MIGQLFEALQSGKELSNPATWKNRQNTINLLVVLIGALAYLANLATGVPIPQDVVNGVAEIVAIILGLVNAYLTTATSKKVGL